MKKYEEIYTELETIVAQLQKENVQIDDAIKLFKRGIELKNECDQILKDANDEVVKIIKEDSNE